MIRAFLLSLSLLFIVPTASEARGVVNVGDTIPSNLEFLDQTGTLRNFSNLTAEKGIILVFVRSANWCPYCQKQLIELDESTERFSRWGYNVVSVSYDTIDEMQKFVATQKPKMMMLSDPTSLSIQAFGVLNEGIAKGTKAYGIPYPSIYIIDKNKKVQAIFFEEGYKDRPAVIDLFTKIEELNPPTIPPIMLKETEKNLVLTEERYSDMPDQLPAVLEEDLIDQKIIKETAKTTEETKLPEKLVVPTEDVEQTQTETETETETESKIQNESEMTDDKQITPIVEKSVEPVSKMKEESNSANGETAPKLILQEKPSDVITDKIAIPPPSIVRPKPVIKKPTNKAVVAEPEFLDVTIIQAAPPMDDLKDDFVDENSRNAEIGDPEMQFIE